MAFADNNGVQINYDIAGSGPPLVLMHGWSGDRTSWRGYGFVDKLKDAYQLILVDSRGHGESSKPYEPSSYDHSLLVDDIIAVLDTLGIRRTHYMGYSLGGGIGFGLASKYPNRLHSLIIGGASPYNRGSWEEPDESLTLYERAVEEGVDVIITTYKAWFGTITPEYEARLRKADLRARVAQQRWWQIQKGFMPDYTAALPSITIPCLIYCGTDDEPTFSECRECAAQLPNATFIELPGMNHVQASGASEFVVPHIRRFLSTIPL
jgi:pimeloyl-ACP methyl ester carboxylesterase